MSLVLLLLFGAMVGGLAKWMMPGKCPEGWVPAIVLGIVGSVVGGLPFGGHPAGIVGSVIGAVAVLYAYSMWSDDR